MDEKKLQQIQDEILKSMNKEEVMEQQIETLSKEIAAKLIFGDIVKEEIEGRPLTFKYRQYQAGGKDKLFMTVASEFMYQMGQEKYKPYMVDVEIDNEMDLQHNLSATVEAFLRHILGIVKAEELGGN